VNNALGFEKKAEKFFPKKQHDAGATNSKWLDFTSNPQFSGTAKYDVSDKIKFKIAATIIQILPNGNMVVQGRQEMRLVNEVREIQMKGIIRPEDVSATNTIPSDKVAELRLSYGGRGELTDAQARPWGQQALDAVMPF
jgi:flagellar L-ring protein precursor FlgH